MTLRFFCSLIVTFLIVSLTASCATSTDRRTASRSFESSQAGLVEAVNFSMSFEERPTLTFYRKIAETDQGFFTIARQGGLTLSSVDANGFCLENEECFSFEKVGWIYTGSWPIARPIDETLFAHGSDAELSQQLLESYLIQQNAADSISGFSAEIMTRTYGKQQNIGSPSTLLEATEITTERVCGTVRTWFYSSVPHCLAYDEYRYIWVTAPSNTETNSALNVVTAPIRFALLVSISGLLSGANNQ